MLFRSATPLFADVPALVNFGPVPLIIELDGAYLRQTMLPALVERHFGADDYRVQVIDPRTPKTPVYSRGMAPDARIDAVNADVAIPFFSVRFDTTREMVASLRPAVPAGTATGSVTAGRFSIVIDERSSQAPIEIAGLKAAVDGTAPPVVTKALANKWYEKIGLRGYTQVRYAEVLAMADRHVLMKEALKPLMDNGLVLEIGRAHV